MDIRTQTERKHLKVGIGFATGRKSFQRVLKSYIYNWKESGLVDDQKIDLNVFIAYDLSYRNTQKKDYVDVRPELAQHVDGFFFIGRDDIQEERANLVKQGVLSESEADRFFRKGYALQRNMLLYTAIRNGMDCLIFLDDDEYPVAVTNTKGRAVWGGQHVLSTHVDHIFKADLTHGHHCGYISPIPYIRYDDALKESDFRCFIEAISNDILNWENIRRVMADGGVTYADTSILTTNEVAEVTEINHSKFISGANLGINLTEPENVFPFYNPPGARGEDSFLATCLGEKRVLKVPCYTFHDGFSTYNHLLEGVLPIRLKFITAEQPGIADRFYKACIGWIRYKPLLLYITQPERYDERVAEMRCQLEAVLPKICTYFQRPDFMRILTELEKYHRNVQRHYREFAETRSAWAKLTAFLKSISAARASNE